jgi:hypothetical protein
MPSSPKRQKHTLATHLRPSETPDIDPRWLLKMLGLVIGAALFCGYLTLCGLFYQGQWQFVLHPDTTTKTTPASVNLSFEDVNFDFTETGQPQLHGWWIPAPGTSGVTVLYLHGGSGSIADTLPQLKELHDAGLNVFAFDYRGFGQSAGPHPNERRMREDTAAAWLYLTQSRKLQPTQIVPYGEGVGASLATQLLVDDPGIAAVILDDPIFDTVSQVRQDPRSQLIPVRLLFRERFALAQPLATLQTPKLFLLDDGPHSPPPAVLAAVADPKLILHLGSLTAPEAAAQRSQSLSRFLDEYLPNPALAPQ